MPSTYTHTELVTFAQSLVKGIPVSNISAIAADQINSIMWMAYPWTWTRAGLTSIPLVDGTQDYAINGADTRFHKLLLARIVNAGVSPVQFRDLRIFRHLEQLLHQKIGWPNFDLISYESEVSKLRLQAAALVPAGATLRIDGQYMMTPLKVTSLATTIVFPDHYSWVYVDGLLWMLYRLANDKRAGQSVLTKGVVQYTGQLGTFYDGLVTMKEQEERHTQDTDYPEESIGGGIDFHSTLFG